jgi:hypothetical protein
MALPDALVSAPFAIAVEAVHQALRFLRFRDGADHMLAHIRKEKGDRANQIAIVVAEAIERQEGRTIATLDEEAAARHIDELSRFVERRTREEWRYDEGEGEAALARLRSEVR